MAIKAKHHNAQIAEALYDIKNMMSRDDFRQMQEDILELTEYVLEPSICGMKDGYGKKESFYDSKRQNANECLTDEARNAYLEIIIKDLLKPKLSQWLDQNLPKIVQQIVEREIKLLMLDKD